MPPSLTTSRSYSARLNPTPGQEELLRFNLELYRIGTETAIDILLDLGAAIRPHDPIAEVLQKVENTGKKKPAILDSEPFVWTNAHACFTNWFVPEQDSTRTDKYLKPEDLKSLFLSRWKDGGGEEIPATLTTHLDLVSHDSLKEGAIWVDRYATGNELREKFDIPRDEVAGLVVNGINHGWPFLVSKEEGDAALFASSFCSLLWGEGKKADWTEAVRFYEQVREELRDELVGETLQGLVAGLTPQSRPGPPDLFVKLSRFPKCLLPDEVLFGNLRPHQIEELAKRECPKIGDNAMADVKSCYKEIGEPVTHESLKKMRKKIDELVADKRKKQGISIDQKWTLRLLNEVLLPKLKVPYPKSPTEFWQFFSLASSALGSWKSNSRNQCKDRVDAKESLDRAKREDDSDPEVLRVVNEEKARTGQRYLKRYQFEGLDDVRRYCQELEISPIEAIRELQAGASLDGDPNLLNRLAALDDHTFRDSERSLKVIAKIDRLEETVNGLFYPTLRHFATRAALPWFGKRTKSLPYGTVLNPEGSRTNRFVVCFELFDPKDGQRIMTEVSANSKRFVKEILSTPDSDLTPETVPAPRNHYLFRLRDKDVPVSPTVPQDQITIQPFPFCRQGEIPDRKNNLLYLRLSVPLVKITPPTKKLVQETPDLRVLAVDRGWGRNPAAYSILQVCGDRDGNDRIPIFLANENPKTKKSTPGLSFRVDKVGSVKDRQSFVNDTVRDRLSGCDRPLTDGELRFFRDTYPDKADPTSYSRFRIDLAYHAKRLVKALPLDEATERVKAIRDFLVDDNTTQFSKGGLTTTRIEALETFQRVYTSLLRLYQDQEWVPPEWLVESFQRLAKKRVSRRRERARVTVSKIVELALKERCQIIAVENLDLATSQNNGRGNNKRLAQWTHRRVTDLLSQACELHGIYLSQIPPAYTSSRDCTHNERHQCRLTRNYQDPDKFAKTIRDVFVGVGIRPDSGENSFFKMRRRWYLGVAEQFGYEPISHNSHELATLLRNRLVPVPHRLGDLYPVKIPKALPKECVIEGKYIDSDINASVNIGASALFYMFSFFKEKKKEVATAEV